ncbi:MAG: metal ABC transporter permease [Thermodesulfobacteriota bacterium]
MEFLDALSDPAIPFLRYALLAGLLASLSFGVIGTYVVARRITYIAGAISHCVLGGIGAGLFLEHRLGITWLGPLSGAVISALVAAIIIGLVNLHAKQREDTAIGALWSIGMAAGLLFIAKTPGYVEPMSYLFGNILLISKTDLWLVLALDALVVGTTLLFYHKFLAVCFDEEYARLRGMRTQLHYLLLLCLTALTVVLLVRVVGIVMVIALLTLPAAVAGNFARGLWQMMVIATLCCMAFISAGLAISFSQDLPSGPVIIVLAGLAYLAVISAKRLLPRQRSQT